MKSSKDNSESDRMTNIGTLTRFQDHKKAERGFFAVFFVCYKFVIIQQIFWFAYYIRYP